MGLAESRLPMSPMKSTHGNGNGDDDHDDSRRSPSAAAATMTRTTTTSKRPDSHLFFYDAAKDSVAIFTDVNTLTRKFQTRKSQSSTSSAGIVTSPTVSQSRRHHHQEKPALCDKQAVGHPPPPPYEVTLGRTPNFESALRTLLANDENSNYTCYGDGFRSLGPPPLLLRFDQTGSDVGVYEPNTQEPQNVHRLFTNEQRYQRELLQRLMQVYNMNAPKGYEFEWVNGSDTFHGFIRVSMNLSHPINVLVGSKPPSIYDIAHEERDCDSTLTSFYLPRDTVKALHVTSNTTTQELITILLRKFKVADDPQKYCLYEKYCEGDSSVRGLLRRMQNHERPLWLVLCWHQEEAWQHRRLVLQENDTGDILWEEFTYPELSNFLKILDREEEEYLKLVRAKYKKIGAKIRRAMLQFEAMENGGGDQCNSEDDDDDDDGDSSSI